MKYDSNDVWITDRCGVSEKAMQGGSAAIQFWSWDCIANLISVVVISRRHHL